MDLKDTLTVNRFIRFEIIDAIKVPFDLLMELKDNHYPHQKIEFIRQLREKMPLNSNGDKISLVAGKQIMEQCWTLWDQYEGKYK